MATTARPSIVHVAEEKAPIPAPGASHDCAPLVERHRQGGAAGARSRRRAIRGRRDLRGRVDAAGGPARQAQARPARRGAS